MVDISVFRGIGREWTPDPTDASWRNLGEIHLDSVPEVENFVARRGDPDSQLGPDRPITSGTWANLFEALRIAAAAWQPLDATGTSYPVADRTRQLEAWRFLDNPYVKHSLEKARVVPNLSRTGLSLQVPKLEDFLIARAIQALTTLLPMRRCIECSMWFEARHVLRLPRFCSPSCRAINHQTRKQQEIQDGVSAEKRDQAGDNPLAKRLVRTGTGRKVSTADKKLRKPKRGPRPRPAHGAGGRAKGRRRPSNA
jgi:hypothetical protein